MIRIVRRNIGNGRRDGGELMVVGRLHELLQIRHYLVELLDDISPLLVVEIIEGLVVVAAELRFRLALEFFQRAAIPKQKMIGKLASGMRAGRRLPAGLLRAESVYGRGNRSKPFGLVVRSAEFVQQNAPQSCRRLLLVLRVGGNG